MKYNSQQPDLTNGLLRCIAGAEFHLLAGLLTRGDIEQADQPGACTVEVLGGNHTRAALTCLFQQGLHPGKVLVTIYKDLTDNEALKVGYHHNVTAELSRSMTFLEKVDIVAKLGGNTKEIATVLGKKVNK